MIEQQHLQKLAEKIEKLRKSGDYDLSLEEDLSLAVMNLVSLEEHFFFTAERTGKAEYLDWLKDVREIRKDLLGRMIEKHEGETWCIAKHLLAATMRLMEVGTKFQGNGKTEEAKDAFAKAYKVYAMFWALRLKLLDLSGAKKIPDERLNVHDKADTKHPWTMEEIMEKLVNCCNE